MRGQLKTWEVESGDQGRWPEPAAMYDSDMAVQIKTVKSRQPEQLEVFLANVAQMKKWAAEGK